MSEAWICGIFCDALGWWHNSFAGGRMALIVERDRIGADDGEEEEEEEEGFVLKSVCERVWRCFTRGSRVDVFWLFCGPGRRVQSCRANAGKRNEPEPGRVDGGTRSF
jgi:hypothetical protein